MKNYREGEKSLYGLNRSRKSLDRVPKGLIWRVLDRRSVPKGYMDIVEDMYEKAYRVGELSVQTAKKFPMTIHLLEGSA